MHIPGNLLARLYFLSSSRNHGAGAGTEQGYMITISISIIILMTAIIVFSLCRVTSRTCHDVYSKSLVFTNKDQARRFEDLLSDGDAESIHRILKALQQRGDIDIIESEKEIYVSETRPASADHGRNIFRDLLASQYDPLEDLRNLTVGSRFDPDFQLHNADKGISVSVYEPVPIHNLEKVTDDLFASEYDLSELLGNLVMKRGLIPTCQTPS